MHAAGVDRNSGCMSPVADSGLNWMKMLGMLYSFGGM